jgi:hypothetical protein
MTQLYGIIDGEWHAVQEKSDSTPIGEDRYVGAMCSFALRPTSVMTYLGGDLCPECRELLTRAIVEGE